MEIIIGAHPGTGIDKSAYMVRVTISTGIGNLYTELRKFLIYVTTNGSEGSYCTITARTQANYLAGNDTWVTFANRVLLGGWPGYNVINTSSIITYANDASNQYGQLRFTFGVSRHSSSSPYSGLFIYSIMGFGGVGWTVPSDMAKYGRMYTYDAGQNVKFPAQVTASGFNGNASSATKLQTARTINGTSFDGTANITTTNWGTARNIYVADSTGAHTGAAVSVNGSGNVTLKLPDVIDSKEQNVSTVFNSNGSITETADTWVRDTVFNSDGSITETTKFYTSSAKSTLSKTVTKKTVFNSNGSITETVS